MKKTKLTKYDLILLGSLLFLSLTFLLVTFLMKKPGDTVQISVDNQVFGTYSLDQDQEIPLEFQGETGNIIRIQNHQVRMIQATCPDKLCMHQKEISKQGETIVCLPHKVVVEIHSKNSTELDGLSQ